MQFIDKIKLGSGDYSVFENKIAYINSQKDLIIGSSKFESGIYSAAIQVDNMVWVPSFDGSKVEIFDIISEQLVFVFGFTISPRPDLYFSNNKILVLYYKDNVRTWGILDLDTFEIIQNYPINYGLNGIFLIVNDHFFLSNKLKILALHKLSDASQLWQFDISEYVEEAKTNALRGIDLMEVYQNMVLLKSSNHFLGLDLNTGAVIWHETLPYSSFYPAIGNGKVYYGLMGYSKSQQKNLFVYFVLDILTGAILHESDQDAALFDNNTQFTRMAVYGDEITFTTQNSNKTYILDSETGSLKCVVEAPKEEVSYFTNMNTAILHQNRLYLTDAEGTLFVFERETPV